MQTTSDWFNAVKDRNHNAVSKNMKAFQGTKDAQGETALMLAVRSRDIQMVKLLAPLETGIFNNHGETALMIASKIDFADGAKHLHPLEGHLHNENGQTALMIAAMNDCSSVIRRLMPETRYDVDSLGRTALALAAEANAVEALRALTTHTNMIYDMDSQSALIYAIIRDNSEALSYLSEFIKESGESLRLSTTRAPTYSKIPSAINQHNSPSSSISPSTLKQVLDQEIDNKLAILERRITEARDCAPGNAAHKRALEDQIDTLNNDIVLMNQHRDKLEVQIAQDSSAGRRKSSVSQMKNAPQRSGSTVSSARAGSTKRPPTGQYGYEQEAFSPRGANKGSASRSGRRPEEHGPWKPLGGRGGKTFDEIAAEAQRQHHPTNNGSNIRYPTPKSGRAGSTNGSALRGSVSGTTPRMAGTPGASGANLRGSMMDSQSGLHRSRIPQPDFSPTGGYRPSDRESDSGAHLMMSASTRSKLVEIYQRKLMDKVQSIHQTLMENRPGLFRLNKRTDNLVRAMRELQAIIDDDDELKKLNVNWERAIDARIERLTNELRVLSSSTTSVISPDSYFSEVGDIGQSVEELIEYISRTDDGDDGHLMDDDDERFGQVMSTPIASFHIDRVVSPEPSPSIPEELPYSAALENAMARNRRLAMAVKNNPRLGRLLSDNENLLEALLSSDKLFDALVSNPKLVSTLSENPELLRKTCLYPDIVAVLSQDESVLREIASDPMLVDQIAADPSVLEVICKDRRTAAKLMNDLPRLPKATEQDVQDGTLLYEVIVENLNPSEPCSPSMGTDLRSPSMGTDLRSPSSTELLEDEIYKTATRIQEPSGEDSVDSTATSLKSRYSYANGPVFAEGERIKASGGYLHQVYTSKEDPNIHADSMCELAAQLIDRADEALETADAVNMTMTPLMKAAKNNDGKTVKSLLKDYAKQQTANGDTALMYAARNGNVKIVKDLLLMEGKMTMKNGETALISAVRQGQAKPLKLLIPHEAKMQSKDGHTALMHAVLNNRPALVKVLAKAEYGIQTPDTQASALMYAAESGQIPLAKPLVRLEAGLRNIDNKTAMMMAAEQGNLPLVKALMKAEGGMQDNDGYTAMMYAAMNGHKSICAALNKIEGGVTDTNGRTALDWAAIAGHDECTVTMTPRTTYSRINNNSRSGTFSGSFSVKTMKSPRSFTRK